MKERPVLTVRELSPGAWEAQPLTLCPVGTGIETGTPAQGGGAGKDVGGEVYMSRLRGGLLGNRLALSGVQLSLADAPDGMLELPRV